MTNLCTAIEPVGRDLICQRPAGHDGMHRAAVPADGGIVTCEWHDLSVIRRRLHRAEA